jgi:hypothetical protein
MWPRPELEQHRGQTQSEIAPDTACRSSASSAMVDLTKTLKRWSGVRILTSPGDPAFAVTTVVWHRLREWAVQGSNL